MTLTILSVIAIILLFVLIGLECIVCTREVLARTEKYKSESMMYDHITAYLNEVLKDL